MLAALLLALLVAACSSVSVFDALVPKDPGSRLAAEGVAYGDDPRQKLDVYVPATAPGHPLPVILFVYGGSWNSGERSSYAFVGKALAARGLVTAVIDTRQVPHVRFPAFVEDVATATAFLKTKVGSWGGDPDVLFVMGHSSGAYDAAMVALDPRFAKAAGLAWPPYRGFVGLAGPYDFLPLDVDATREAFAGTKNLALTQPARVAHRGAPATFLATGDKDTTVLPRNSAELATRLRQLGVPVVEKTYAGLGHAGIVTALAVPLRERAPVLDDVVDFVTAVPGSADQCRCWRHSWESVNAGVVCSMPCCAGQLRTPDRGFCAGTPSRQLPEFLHQGGVSTFGGPTR